jgi:hypothetical protein
MISSCFREIESHVSLTFGSMSPAACLRSVRSRYDLLQPSLTRVMRVVESLEDENDLGAWLHGHSEFS